MSTFIENVKTIMSHRGLSQYWLESETGIAQSSISRVLAGKERMTIDRAQRVADALDVPMSELFLQNDSVCA